MITPEQGAALHGQIANALRDADDGLTTVVKTRLRRLQELVDDLLPDIDRTKADVIAEHKFSTEGGDTLECGIIEINEDRQPVAYAQLGDTTASICRNKEGRVVIEIDDTAGEDVYVFANTQPLLSAGHLGYGNVSSMPWTGDELKEANEDSGCSCGEADHDAPGHDDLPLILALDDDYCPKSEDETHHFGEDHTCDHCGAPKEE